MPIEDLFEVVGDFTINTGFLSNCELQRPPPIRSPVRTREVAGYYSMVISWVCGVIGGGREAGVRFWDWVRMAKFIFLVQVLWV
jgi:hypothetical protein